MEALIIQEYENSSICQNQQKSGRDFRSRSRRFAFFNDRKARTRRLIFSRFAPRRITTVFGRNGRGTQLRNNSKPVLLHLRRRNASRGNRDEMLLPRMWKRNREGMGSPKLDISQHHKFNPLLFMLDIRSFKSGQEQILFSKAKRMFEVKTLTV